MRKIPSAVLALAALVLVGAGCSSTQSTSTGGSDAGGKTFTMMEVAAHGSASDCYTAINGLVYDLTAWISRHPGGQENIISICGKDGSAAFNGQHGTQGRPESILDTYKIGALAQ